MKEDIVINDKKIGNKNPTYFIADIAANHDGDINRAKELIYLAKEAGADAAKFQHFKAEKIVSAKGFKDLGKQQSHQSNWKKSVVEVYRDASVSTEWTQSLYDTCKEVGITFFTSPYDLEIVDHIDPYVPAYKIGSGDINWLEIIEKIAGKNKPYILATGASTLEDVLRAVTTATKINSKIVLMQCNTNYTASIENLSYVNLNVLKTYQIMFPEVILGLSDHTPGHTTVLGAVSLGASMIEKHFTDDTNREGPDHKFSMNPIAWKEMVLRTRELEAALGSSIKKIEDNESETIILQRRCIRIKNDLLKGHILTDKDLEVLRPAPINSIPPYKIKTIIGKKLRINKKSGEDLKINDME